MTALSTEIKTPRKRKAMTKKTRFEVFKRDSFKCQYCGASAPEAILVVDHIDPVSKDGAEEMTNYITACQPCNAGKSDRKLSDNTTLLKQKAQLDELNERRAQLEMMLEWRNGLKDVSEMQLEAVLDAWSEAAPFVDLNDTGIKEVKRHIKKYGLPAVLDALELSVEKYLELDEDGNIPHESACLVWEKVGGILYIKSRPDALRDLHYIKGILRNRLSYIPANIMKLLEAAQTAGVNTEDIKTEAKETRNWTSFNIWLAAAKGSL